jgi:hypothetical protein
VSNPRLARILALTAGVLLLSPAFAAAQEVEGQYIVVMKDGSTATETQQSQRQVSKALHQQATR